MSDQDVPKPITPLHIQAIADRLVNDETFNLDLTGYAASAAAAELVAHWETCDPELTDVEKRGDVDAVIAELTRWKQTHVAAGKYRNGAR